MNFSIHPYGKYRDFQWCPFDGHEITSQSFIRDTPIPVRYFIDSENSLQDWVSQMVFCAFITYFSRRISFVVFWNFFLGSFFVSRDIASCAYSNYPQSLYYFINRSMPQDPNWLLMHHSSNGKNRKYYSCRRYALYPGAYLGTHLTS